MAWKYEVPVGGTLALLARLAVWGDDLVLQVDVSTLTYTIKLLDEATQETTDVTGHATVDLTPEDVISDTLVNDAEWTVDEIGRNFRHVPPNRTTIPFAIRGRKYIVEYTITPDDATEQKVVFTFHVLAT